ncbi:MAG: nuclear transport factor 2 family protein [Actinomycetota bacterium]|nr:nuclear transport factor 2 family protein [Actinomycetota bacterium]
MSGASATDVADRLFSAIEAGDVDAIRMVYSPDVVVWHNVDEQVEDRDANLATLGWVIHNLPGLRYTAIRRQATDDGFVQQHVIVATNRAGREVALPACIVATVRDGLITRIDEYLDSVGVAALSE